MSLAIHQLSQKLRFPYLIGCVVNRYLLDEAARTSRVAIASCVQPEQSAIRFSTISTESAWTSPVLSSLWWQRNVHSDHIIDLPEIFCRDEMHFFCLGPSIAMSPEEFAEIIVSDEVVGLGSLRRARREDQAVADILPNRPPVGPPTFRAARYLSDVLALW